MDLFKLVGSIYVDNEAANESISKTDEKASGLGTTLSEVAAGAGKVATTVASAAVAVGSAVVDMVSDSASEMDVIDKASQKMGITAEAYQEWAHAMSLSGMDISVMQTGMKTLQNQMDGVTQGTASSIEAFDRLGVSVYDANGEMKDQTTMLNEVIAALADMDDGAERTALAVDMFGKSGTEMLPLLNSGTEAIEAMKEEAHELGLVFTDEDVKAGATMNDTLSNIKDSFSSLVTRLGTTVMPLVQTIGTRIVEFIPTIQSMFEQLSPVITELMDSVTPVLIELIEMILPTMVQLLNTLMPVISAILPLITPILELLLEIIDPILQLIDYIIPILIDFLMNDLPTALGKTIDFIANVVSVAFDKVVGFFIEDIPAAFNKVISFIQDKWNTYFQPWIEILKRAAELFNNDVLQPVLNYVNKVWNKLKTGAQDAWNGIKKVFGPVATFFGDIFSKAWAKVCNVFSVSGEIFTDIKDALVKVFKKVVNGLIDGINKVIAIPFNAINNMLQKLHDLTILGVKPFQWIDTFSVPEIPKLAKGGDVAETGRAIVGEAGAELIELPQGARVTPLEQNGIDDKIDELIALIKNLVGIQTGGYGVYLDGGAIVGKLAPEIDKSLGRLAVLSGRRV